MVTHEIPASLKRADIAWNIAKRDGAFKQPAKDVERRKLTQRVGQEGEVRDQEFSLVMRLDEPDSERGTKHRPHVSRPLSISRQRLKSTRAVDAYALSIHDVTPSIARRSVEPALCVRRMVGRSFQDLRPAL